MMTAFNSYTVYDEEGHLLAHDRVTQGIPTEYFANLGPDTRRSAHVLLVLQEGRYVIRYKVSQQSEPVLGPREDLRGNL